jgi:predicted DNA-binding transcriptional regulator AlpA
MKTTPTSGNMAATINPVSNLESTDRWVTKPEVAAHLRISVRSVEKRMTEGLPYHPFGRSIRFLLSEVDAYARTVTLKIDTSRKKIDPCDATQQSIALSGPPPHINVTKPESPKTKGRV